MDSSEKSTASQLLTVHSSHSSAQLFHMCKFLWEINGTLHQIWGLGPSCQNAHFSSVHRNHREVLTLQVWFVMGSLFWQMSAGISHITGSEPVRATHWMSNFILVLFSPISLHNAADLSVRKLMMTSQCSSDFVIRIPHCSHGTDFCLFCWSCIRSHGRIVNISRLFWRCGLWLKWRERERCSTQHVWISHSQSTNNFTCHKCATHCVQCSNIFLSV